jgi:hypothetical protein
MPAQAEERLPAPVEEGMPGPAEEEMPARAVEEMPARSQAPQLVESLVWLLVSREDHELARTRESPPWEPSMVL